MTIVMGDKEHIPAQQWARLQTVLLEVEDLAENRFGSRGLRSVYKICGIDRDSFNKYKGEERWPRSVNTERLAKALGMRSYDLNRFFEEGVRPGDPQRLSEPEVVAYLKSLPPEKMLQIVSEASSRYKD